MLARFGATTAPVHYLVGLPIVVGWGARRNGWRGGWNVWNLARGYRFGVVGRCAQWRKVDVLGNGAAAVCVVIR